MAWELIKLPRCDCGQLLTGRQSKWCTECTVKADPGSSQCPFCFEWYFTHSARKGTAATMEIHAKGKCKSG